MNKNKLSAILYYVAALAFYIAAIMEFIDKDHMGALDLCLGSAMLCLGSVHMNKYKKDTSDLENKPEDKSESHE